MGIQENGLLKQCTKCKTWKNTEEFNKDAKTSDKKQYTCRQCQNKYKYEHKEHIKKMMRKLVERKYFRHWATNTINCHKYRHFIIDIDLDDLENLAKSSMYCKLCDIKLDWEYGNKNRKPVPSSPTLDRINNELHLTIDNIQIICHECNSTKRTKTMEEFYNYCKMITEKFGDMYE